MTVHAHGPLYPGDPARIGGLRLLGRLGTDRRGHPRSDDHTVVQAAEAYGDDRSPTAPAGMRGRWTAPSRLEALLPGRVKGHGAVYAP